MEIKKLEELIKPILKDARRFLTYKCVNLLSSGENYGSTMLRVDIKVLNRENHEETIYCVAKMCPPRGFLWKVFNTEVTFKNEIAIYDSIVPLLNEFGKSKGINRLIDFFAKHVGARISLDPKSAIVDSDAVLLLENLKVQGYDVVDRFSGFNMECTKLILKDLAVMHAAPIALKLAKPEEFKSKILPHLHHGLPFTPDENVLDSLIAQVEKAAILNVECIPHMPKVIENLNNLKTPTQLKAMEPYATIVHNDFWVNNTMLKIVNGKPEKNIMVDFQNIEYSSPANDLIFFLYTSVSLPVLKGNVDYLINYYYEIFISTLQKLKCTTTLFSFETFVEEIKKVSKAKEFSHIIFMLTIIFTRKEKARELSTLKENDIIQDEDSLHENFYEKLHFVVLDFVKRGWLS